MENNSVDDDAMEVSASPETSIESSIEAVGAISSTPCKTSAAAPSTPVPATPSRRNLPPAICNNTPIASLKRPSSSNSTTNSSMSTSMNNTPSSPLHPVRIMKSHDIAKTEVSSAAADESSSSTASWTKKKVDNIFSPVLQYINGTQTTNDDAANADATDVMSCKEEEEDLLEEEEDSFAISKNIDIEEEEEECDDSLEEEEEFNPYLFIRHLPPYTSCAMGPILPKKLPSTPAITLVLDLDETLVHCTVDPIPNPDIIFPVLFHGISYQVHVKTRPYLESFLLAVANKFEVVCFTASQRIYADELLNRIDPHKCIKHRLFRDHCLPVEGNFLKDLNVLGRDLNQTILVDNSPHAFGYQVDNGIPIESWFDDDKDRELQKLEEFLETLHGDEDVRMKIRQKFGVWKLVMEA